MSVNRTAETVIGLEFTRRKPSILEGLLRFVKMKPLGTVGGLLLLLMVVVALLAPFLATYDPYEVHSDALFAPPGTHYILGTDNFGRDLYSRIVYGARISLYVGIVAIATGSTLGALVGVIGGYLGGRADMIIQRTVDTMMSFPLLVLALTIVAALGPSINNVAIAIATVIAPRSARVVRSSALSVKENQYIEAARVIGSSSRHIILRHVLPNCIAPFIIIATAQLGEAILTEASLSFLGLGTPPPNPSWGEMLSGAGREFVRNAPWMAIFPGVAITLAVFGINLFGDALRDVLDPRLRR